MPHCLSLNSDKQNAIVPGNQKADNKYSNLNLNQTPPWLTLKESNDTIFYRNNEKFQDRTFDESGLQIEKKIDSWNVRRLATTIKSNVFSDLSHDLDENKLKKIAPEDLKDSSWNRSTLSLHIAAYEDSTDNFESETSKNPKKVNKLI